MAADEADPVGSLALFPGSDLRRWKLVIAVRREGRSLSQSHNLVSSRRLRQTLLRPKGQNARHELEAGETP